MWAVVFIGAWIAGLLVGLEADVYVPALVSFSLAAAILAYLLKLGGVSPWPGVLAVVLLVSVVRVEAAERPASGVPADSLRSITIVGEVVSDPELSARGVEFTVSVRAVDLGAGWVEDRGKVLVFARPTSELVRTRGAPYFRYGDSLELTGRLEAPLSFGGFGYGAYLANQGIRSTMAFPQVRVLEEGGGNPVLREVYGLRRKLSGGIDEALPEPQASLGRALLLGLRGRLPADVRDEFRSTGTSHLLAISGLHVGIVLALSAAAGAWLMGRRRQVYLLLPLVAIWLYTLLSGLAPSVERAAAWSTPRRVRCLAGSPGYRWSTS